MAEISIAQKVLETWEASAEKLPTSGKKEADWLATLGGFRLLIEEKTKLEDPARTAARSVAFRANEVFGTTTPLSRNNCLSGIIKTAAGQLASTGGSLNHDARVVWLTAVGADAKTKYHQTVATLYGTSKVFELGKPHMRDCYFFRDSDFFRFRSDLDGAIVASLNDQTVTMKLCLNPYADRWQALRDSPFASKFNTGLVDPVAEEASGHALIADTDVDRQDASAVLAFLQKKYKVERLLNMDLNMTSAEVVVPK